MHKVVILTSVAAINRQAASPPLRVSGLRPVVHKIDAIADPRYSYLPDTVNIWSGPMGGKTTLIARLRERGVRVIEFEEVMKDIAPRDILLAWPDDHPRRPEFLKFRRLAIAKTRTFQGIRVSHDPLFPVVERGVRCSSPGLFYPGVLLLPTDDEMELALAHSSATTDRLEAGAHWWSKTAGMLCNPMPKGEVVEWSYCRRDVRISPRQ